MISHLCHPDPVEAQKILIIFEKKNLVEFENHVLNLNSLLHHLPVNTNSPDADGPCPWRLGDCAFGELFVMQDCLWFEVDYRK